MNITKKLSPELTIAGLGVLCIFLLSGYALYRGVDGVMFSAAMSSIGAIIGFIFKSHFVKK